MGRISPGPTRWPPGAERRLVPAKSILKPETCCEGRLVSGALPAPAVCPWSGQPAPVRPRRWRSGHRGPASSHSVRTPACCLGGGGASHLGGASCRCEGRLRLGACPPPAPPLRGGQSGSGSAARLLWARVRVCGCGDRQCPFGARALRGGARRGGGGRSPQGGNPRCCPRFLGASGVGVGTQHSTPPTACVPACRGGGERASPGGCLAPRQGASGARRSPSPSHPSSGRVAGVRRPCVMGVTVRVWGPIHVPWHVCPVGGCALRGRREEAPGGGTSHHCGGRLVSGASLFQQSVLGAGSQALLPAYLRRGWCERGDPAPAPQRCEGGGWSPLGGVPRAIMRGVCARICAGYVLALPWLPNLGMGSQGRPFTCGGRRRADGGARHCPFGVRAVRRAARRGGGGRRPQRGDLSQC